MIRIPAPRSLALALSALAAALLPLAVHSQTPVWPGEAWEAATPAQAGMDASLLNQARDYSLSVGPQNSSSGFIARGGRRVYFWGSTTAVLEVKSVTKSIGSAALAFALGATDPAQRLSLSDRAQTHLASIGVPPDLNNGTGWLDDITIEQLATHSAGFEKPGGFCNLLTQPGTQWSYSDCAINWLADVLTSKFQQDLYVLLNDRVFTPLSIDATELRWRENVYRGTTLNGVPRRELASGISASVDALARIGLLFARDGMWGSQRILPQGLVAQVSRPAASIGGLPIDLPERYPGAASHYGILWWTNGDGRLAGVPRDAFWGWGLADQLLVVIPSLDLVIVRIGRAWNPNCETEFCTDYEILEPFLEPIVASVANTGPTVDAGEDQSITLPQGASLSGTVIDDGLPLNQSKPVGWTLVSGGSGVTISSPDQVTTNVSFTNAGTYVFEFRASDGALEASDQVQVTVAAAPPPPPPPTATLSASPGTVTAGGNATLTWSSTNATSCSASGGWSGSRAVSGSESVGPISQNTTYTLECTGAGGSIQQSVTITAAPAPTPAGGGGGGGGGGALDWLALTVLLCAAAAARSRIQPSRSRTGCASM